MKIEELLEIVQKTAKDHPGAEVVIGDEGYDKGDIPTLIPPRGFILSEERPNRVWLASDNWFDMFL